jgi:hypothetical protein
MGDVFLESRASSLVEEFGKHSASLACQAPPCAAPFRVNSCPSWFHYFRFRHFFAGRRHSVILENVGINHQVARGEWLVAGNASQGDAVAGSEWLVAGEYEGILAERLSDSGAGESASLLARESGS